MAVRTKPAPPKESTGHDLGNWRWRVANLYTITDENGRVVPFRPNSEQERFMDEMHTLNLILKARQRGFTTLIDLIINDACMFRAETSAGIIAHTVPAAIAIFEEKIRKVYDRLPESLRNAIGMTQDAAHAVAYTNGSKLRVDTSHRSGTLQLLHISEYGKIAAKRPDAAREIRTGALNTVHAGNFIFVESTAEGRGGEYHDLYELTKTIAAECAEQGIPLSPMDWKLYFAPWWRDERYRLKSARTLSAKHVAYFKELQRQHGIKLDPEQKAWYAQKAQTQKDDMRREYPSYAEEAFDAPVEGAYYTHEMTRAFEQGRVGEFPYDPKLGAVYTFWDLGRSDLMTIWLGQRDGPSRWRWIRSIEGQDKSFPHYARLLLEIQEDLDCVYGGHFLPHDGGRTDLSVEESRSTTLENLRIFPVHIVPRTKDLAGPALSSSINLVKAFIEISEFDRQGCATGLKHLSNYRREWNDNLAQWNSRPFHNQASDGADGFRTAAEADYQGLLDAAYYDNDDGGDRRDDGRDPHGGY
jgi:hypothetical protein